ncbi:hypothetical protein A2714_01145 [Candidatus Woesebacteria bacterium RIFCSPHIGHO2_01_FULL_38_9]|uniref:peptidylprolyl isomerase n=1 Tax=Candidatus Woesebacteria bacterium RIFCSPHIGHO2_01_FULL_38_9 TaxID=1802492 RepID=A0A1F7XYQ2_9BACT|nr:MAG: hypothetical protein A2714_01145 [Candidatus Woesebacteria bacterium RIFCSPHIGHO2_01_FULL_38_9]
MVAKKKTKVVAKAPIKTKTKKFSLKSLVSDIRKNKRSRYIYIGLALLLTASLLYLGRSLFVAALVSGRPITRLSLVKSLEKQGGKQALDNLITKELISQETKKEGVSVTNDQVQEEIKRIEGLVTEQGSTLDAALALQGQTRKDLEENIKIQKSVEKLLEEELQVTEDEIKAYFEQNKTFYGEGAKIENLQEDIREQIKSEKFNQAFESWVEKLRSESKIIYFVDF